MKKFSILFIAFIALIGFNACSSDDDVVFIAQPDPEGISFTNSFSSVYVLTPATAGNTAERFVWNEVDFEVPTNITYELQGAPIENFKDYAVLGSTSQTNLAVSVQQMLDLAEEAGLDNDPATENPNTGTLYFRVVASAGTEGGMAHTSEVEALTVLLPEDTDGEEETFRNFFLVGDATAAGWDPNNNNTPLFRDADNPDVYYYTGYFGSGEFKLLEVLGQWQPQWGLDNGELTSSDILGGDPGAFTVDTEGYYTLEINVDEMTYSFEPFDASGAATYTTIGLIGDATPGAWDTDTDMTQLDTDPHIWYITDFELGQGEFKFRAEDDWTDNWGAAQEGLSGKTNYGSGDNMSAPAGIYNIWFNDITGRYILIPQGE